jgi:hypothetical protein
MLCRTLAFVAVTLASACARPSPRLATVLLDPGEGTLLARDVGAGGERVCSAGTECRLAQPTRTALELELSWPRPDGAERATRRVTVTRDLAIRGAWIDRSGPRIAGGLVLALGGAVGAGVTVLGAMLLTNARRDSDVAVAILGTFGGVLVTVVGVAAGAASIVLGSVLLGLRDHATIEVGPLRDGHVMLLPAEGGATLSFDARF